MWKTDDGKNIKKLTVAFRNFENAPKNDSAPYRFLFLASVFFRTNPMVEGGGGTGSGNEQRPEAIERTLDRDSFGGQGPRNEVFSRYSKMIYKLYISVANLIAP
jgi:hypothetical protein